MTSPELENLAKVGALKREPPSRQGFDGLVQSVARGSGLALQHRPRTRRWRDRGHAPDVG
jgi:hypothetical protein